MKQYLKEGDCLTAHACGLIMQAGKLVLGSIEEAELNIWDGEAHIEVESDEDGVLYYERETTIPLEDQ